MMKELEYLKFRPCQSSHLSPAVQAISQVTSCLHGSTETIDAASVVAAGSTVEYLSTAFVESMD